ncbi:MAG: hypothetical protein ACRCXE_02115 [Metamycoplasmataceae bacterium]
MIAAIIRFFYEYSQMKGYYKFKHKNFLQIVPDGRNLEKWNLKKDTYLKSSIAMFICSMIELPFVIAIISLIITNNAPEISASIDFFTSPMFIMFCFMLFVSLINFVFSFTRRKIIYGLFFNKNFAEDVNLKRFSWFFKKYSRIVLFTSIPSSFIHLVFAIMLYKDIEKNNANVVQEN